MAHSSHSDSEGGSSVWSLLNVIIAIAVGGFALFWSVALIGGGISAAIKKRNPAPAVAAAPAPAPAAAPSTPTAAAAADHAPAAPAASSGPAQELLLKPDAVNPMAFNTREFKVKAGQTVRLTFDNTAAVPLPHNVVVGKAGSKDALMAAAMKIATDPQGMAKGYIPEDPNVIAHTTLVQPGKKETIEFVPASPGDYPYLCAFPGHSILMNGVIKAE